MHHSTSTTSANAAPPPKPIRFVTNNDGPYAKRRRINSACLTCRKKKTRCSGERPVCETCKKNKHECAGYGADEDHKHNASSPTDTTKDAKKLKHRQSDASSHPPARRTNSDAAPPHAIAPELRVASTGSQHASESSSHARPVKHEESANPPRVNTEIAHGTPSSGQHSLSLSTRNRMPYFRYFGPTAIMPGFKQMVVKVRGKQHSTGHTSSDPLESSPGHTLSMGQMSPPAPEARTPVEIPVYDTSAVSPSPLITHLCQLFFVHVGCNFPFLQKERFMRDLEEKQVDAILVDAMCALAARFSTDPLLTGAPISHRKGESRVPGIQPPEYGQAFAQRAKSAIPDTFSCPNVAVVQAALLLAYDEFGANRDSGLWMYLGISIRMAQDLGMQTLEGLKYEGRDGPTPKSVKTTPNGSTEPLQHSPGLCRTESSDAAIAEQRAVERERTDTFWAIFLLDRAVCSGTGRPVTLRDRDIELSFPSLDEVDPISDYPLPFAALIRIVHLYGRVTDVLNGIKEKAGMTDPIRKQLAAMETQLTELYQSLSPKLHFSAINLQQYVKMNQGTNFVLLHCWFHTLIVLLHQPTLLKNFEGGIQPDSAHSRELSVSSAKTLADILAFTDIIDANTVAGNPFTSQPIYIAACAFLKETALQTASSNPHSRPSTPGSVKNHNSTESHKISIDHMEFNKPPPAANGDRILLNPDDPRQSTKHTLLATAANNNYQRCYRSLKGLETYWSGVKYILTVLDQKAKGVVDPLLYSREEVESALEVPRPEPSFTSPGWRRKLSWGTYLATPNLGVAEVPASIRAHTPTIPGSPMLHASQAIGWSLTGTMNSPSTNVAVMYNASENGVARDSSKPLNSKSTSQPGRNQPSIASVLSNPPTSEPSATTRIKTESPAQLMPSPSSLSLQSPAPPFDPTTMPPPSSIYQNVQTPDPALVSDADLLLNLHSPYSANSPRNSGATYPASQSSLSVPPAHTPAQDFSAGAFGQYPSPNNGMNSGVLFGDMMIESQDIDMSALPGDMMPWDLEYMPHDMWGFTGDGSTFLGDHNGT